jgi:AraC-like DNA-binding protein
VPVVVRTRDVAAEERFDYYKETLVNAPVPLELRSEDPTVFDVVMSQAALGEMTVVSLSSKTSGPYQTRRGRTMIRRSDPEAYRIVLNVRGAARLEYEHRQVSLGPGDLALYDTSQPFHGWRGTGAGRDDWVMMTFPRTLLPLHARGIREALGTLLPGDQGIGALMGDVLRRLAKDAERYRPDDALRLSTTVLDLLTLLIARRTDALGSVSPEAARRALLVRIKAFIERRLGDPDLSPGTIAAAHHISTRYLHALCQDEGITVGAWVRTRRLERFRRDLADPLLAAVPIHVIGSRWGLHDAAQLSRQFRAVYGMSPRQYRLLQTGGRQAGGRAYWPESSPE